MIRKRGLDAKEISGATKLKAKKEPARMILAGSLYFVTSAYGSKLTL